MFAVLNRVEYVSQRRLLYFFFVAVLITRIMYVLAAPSYARDAYLDYEVIADNIVAGKGYCASPGFYWHTRTEPTALFAPLYTYFYAGAKYICGSSAASYWLIRLIQCFVSAVSSILVFRVTRILFNQTTAFLTTLVFWLHPIYSHYAGRCNEATFVVFMCLICVYLALRLSTQTSFGRSALLGLAMGFGILLNPSLLPGLVILTLYVAYSGRSTPSHTAKTTVLAISLALLVIAPWTFRNYYVFRKVVFVKSCFGMNLWAGNNEFATGSSIYKRPEHANSKKRIQEFYPFLSEIKSMNEVQRDEVFREEALRFMRNQPRRAVMLALRKAFYFWIYDKYKLQTLTRDKRISSRRAMLWKGHAIVNIVLVGLCLAAVYLLWRSGGLNIHRVVILLFVLSISSVYVVTVVGMIRFRLPLDPFIQMFSMSTISFLSRR